MADALNPEMTARVLDTVRKDLAHAEHLPGEIYTSRAVLEREIDRIFRTDWLCVGRVEEVTNPGDYKAVNIVGEPLLSRETRLADSTRSQIYADTVAFKLPPMDAATRNA